MKNKVFVKIKGMYMDPYAIDINEDLKDPVLINNPDLVEIPKVDDIEISEDDKKTDNEEIEIISVGRYGVVNGNEYIKYEELDEDGSKIKNTIKISEKDEDGVVVELSKKGKYQTHMIFHAGKKSTSAYATPFGSLLLGIYTRSIRIKRETDKIIVKVDYSLDINYDTVSDCNVEIHITSQLEE